VERELAALDQEEDRILAAYRTNVTSLRQFEKEIGKINARRAACEALLAKAKSAIPAIPAEREIRRDVSHWGATVRKRLTALTDEERQELLGCLLTEIVIFDDHVRMSAMIPANTESTSGIVPTPSQWHGHNPTGYSFEVLLQLTTRRKVDATARAAA
jgi:hypothetical protein